MRVAASYERFQRSLMVSLTSRCNIECAHCAVSSGPKRSERLSAERLIPALTELLELGRIEALAVSGGEPFLELGTLRQIAAVAKSHGAALAVHTNGYWAKTPERAGEVLRGLPGISQLQVSADEYHQDHLSIDRVRNALEAALDCGLHADLLVCTWQGDDDPFHQQLRDALGDRLLSRVEILSSRIDPVGRGASLRGRCIEPLHAQLPAGRCLQVNRPTLTEDGNLCACCNLTVANRAGENPLRLGKLSDGALGQTLARSELDWLIHALRVGGPRYLAELARSRGGEAVFEKRYRSAAMCDLCDDLWTDRSMKDAVFRALSDPDVRAEIAALRALLYRETAMLEAELADTSPDEAGSAAR